MNKNRRPVFSKCIVLNMFQDRAPPVLGHYSTSGDKSAYLYPECNPILTLLYIVDNDARPTQTVLKIF